MRLIKWMLITGGWLLFVNIQGGWAQTAKIKSGDKIRVTYGGAVTTRTSGIMQGVTDDSLQILKDDATMAFALASIKRLDVSVGKKKRTGRGAWIGALSGGLLLGLIAMASDTGCRSDEDWCIDFDSGFIFGTGFLVGAIGGGFVGLVVGGFTKTDQWQQVPLDAAFEPVAQQSLYEISAPKITLKWSF